MRSHLARIALLLTITATVLLAQDRPPAGSAPTPAGTASISGVAQLNTNGQLSPVRRARVFVRGDAGAVLTTDTDTLGQFRVGQLAAGSYRIEIDKPGVVPIGRVPAIVIRDGQQARLNVVMQRGAAIEGRIIMQDGEPAAGLNVSAVQLGYGPYGKKPVAIRQTVSDDLGRFRLHSLVPGEYYIQAAADPLRMLESRSPGVTPMWTYYAGTPRLNEARVVSVTAEQQLSNIAFTLMPATQSAVFGSVLASNGQPPTTFSVRVQRVGAPPGEVRCLLTGGPKQPSFQCPNVPPGDYWMLAAARTAAGAPLEFGALRITAAGHNIEDLTVATTPGVPVTGRIEVEGGGTLPAGVQVSALETEFEYPAPGGGPSAPPVSPAADGSFTFPSLAGARLFRLQRLPDDWALKGVWIDATDVSDTPVMLSPGLSPGQPPTLRIVLTSATGSVEGTVTVAEKQPAPARMVVVFAEDERRWGARSRFIRSAETDANGHYLIRGLLPGQYRVAFIEPLADGGWEDPEVLGNLRPSAAQVVVKAAERVTLDGRMR